MKICFMGTPEFSVKILENLIKNHDVCLVVSQPDKPQGRNKQLVNTPVKEVALKNNIEVFQPVNIKNDYKKIIDKNPDLIITCAYGQMIPEEVLKFPKYKAINIHSSLLPKYRGGAPMHRAIMNGDEKTGITIMYMEKKMDSGNIIKQVEIPILREDTLESMHDKLSELGSKIIIDVLDNIKNISSFPQNEDEVTYAPIIKREEELLDFNNTCKNIFNKVRGLYPFPATYIKVDGIIVKIYKVEYEEKVVSGENGQVVNNQKKLEIKCSDGIINILELQVSGKKRMTIKEYLNGQKLFLEGKIINI